MPVDRQKYKAIRAYLERNIMEFMVCKRVIFERLGFTYTTFVDLIMQRLAKRVPIFYAEYLSGKMDKQILEKFVKREIRIVLCTQSEIYNEPALNMGNKISKHVDYLFKHIYPVFFPFEGMNELANILESAQQMADEKDEEVEMIFADRIHHDEFLKKFYKNQQELKKKLEQILMAFSLKSIIERLTAPASDSAQNLETIDNLLNKYRDEISKSPEQQKHLQKIQTILEEYIDFRIRQVFK